MVLLPYEQASKGICFFILKSAHTFACGRRHWDPAEEATLSNGHTHPTTCGRKATPCSPSCTDHTDQFHTHPTTCILRARTQPSLACVFLYFFFFPHLAPCAFPLIFFFFSHLAPSDGPLLIFKSLFFSPRAQRWPPFPFPISFFSSHPTLAPLSFLLFSSPCTLRWPPQQQLTVPQPHPTSFFSPLTLRPALAPTAAADCAPAPPNCVCWLAADKAVLLPAMPVVAAAAAVLLPAMPVVAAAAAAASVEVVVRRLPPGEQVRAFVKKRKKK